MTSRTDVQEALSFAFEPHNPSYRIDCGDRLVILAKAYREQEKEIADLREKLLQEESLKLKYHRDNLALSARNVELADMVEGLKAEAELVEKVVEAAMDWPLCIHSDHYPKDCRHTRLRAALAALALHRGKGK